MFKFRLSNPEETVTVVDQDGTETVYHDGEEFELPRGWKYDREFSNFVKRPSFSYETRRKTRDQMTGKWTTVSDVKRVSLPVVEVAEPVNA